MFQTYRKVLLHAFTTLFILSTALFVAYQPVSAFSYQNTQPDAEADAHDLILLEIQRMRAELNELHSIQQLQIEDKADRINDRLAALDRRLLTIEGRVNSVFGEFNTFELNLAIAVGMMLAVAFITVLSLVIIRRKTIDPVHVQIANLKATLENKHPEISGDAHKLKLALRDLAKDDPFLSQILNRHGLI